MGTPLTKKEKDKDDSLELVASGLLVFFLLSTPVLLFYFLVMFVMAFSSMTLFLIFLIVAPPLFIFEAFNIYKNISSKKQEAIKSFKIVEKYRSLRKEEEYEKQFVMENL